MNCSCFDDDKKQEYVQGDTFKRQVSILDCNNEPVDASLISKVEFLLLDMDSNLETSTVLNYESEINKWKVEEDTSDWATETHIVRYKVTFRDRTVKTSRDRLILIKK